MFNVAKLKNFDNSFIIPIILLCIIGAVTVFSSTYYFNNAPSQLFYSQILFYVAGIFIFIGISILNVRKLNNKFFISAIFIALIISLVLVLFIGNVANGAQRWINIGPFTLQPSEFAKLVMIFVASFAYSQTFKKTKYKLFNIYEENNSESIRSIRKFLRSPQFLAFVLSTACLGLTILLVIKQKSLGNSVLITLTYASIVLASFNLKRVISLYIIPVLLSVLVSFNFIDLSNVYNVLHFSPKILGIDIVQVLIAILFLYLIYRVFKLSFVYLTVIFLVILPIAPIANFTYNNILEDYQKQRISTFLNPSSEKQLNEDYNKQMALEAIGSSQLIGKGFMHGNVVNSGLLPFPYTDFAYAAYAEQFGFIGVVALIGLYVYLLNRIFIISQKTDDKFSRLLCFGVGVMILLNTLQHICMNLGLTPITGVPLPLISYGGSSVMVFIIGLALVHSVHLDNQMNPQRITHLGDEYGIK